jgi:peptidoglycan hydrolase-like protein with peptidoglycan-binding domain
MTVLLHPHWANDHMILQALNRVKAIRAGDRGSGVRLLKQALAIVGAPPLSSEAAELLGVAGVTQVKQFQALYTLAADGISGALTIGRLNDLLFDPTQRKPWPAAGAAPVPTGPKAFFERVNAAGAAIVRGRPRPLPVSVMLACAGVESGYGTGAIFTETRNLFSLQKWPKVTFPTTTLGTYWRETVVQTNPKVVRKAPFNRATDDADSVRQWCEWIEHWGSADGPPGSEKGGHASGPAVTQRDALFAMVDRPLEMAASLWRVGFGERQHAALYAKVLSEHDLTRFD